MLRFSFIFDKYNQFSTFVIRHQFAYLTTKKNGVKLKINFVSIIVIHIKIMICV